jgi:hypothetical protein
LTGGDEGWGQGLVRWYIVLGRNGKDEIEIFWFEWIADIADPVLSRREERKLAGKLLSNCDPEKKRNSRPYP